jgi:hypothetical protein
VKQVLTTLLYLLLSSTALGSQATLSHQLTCGEFVAAKGYGSSPRWQLTGNLRLVHRETPRIRGRFMLVEGCMAVLLDRDSYNRVFTDRFQLQPPD